MMDKSRKIGIISAGIALFVLSACYVVDNLPFSFGGTSSGQRFQQLKEYVAGHEDKLPDDYLAVNIAYDRQLVDVADEYGFYKGNLDITDRHHLLWLLENMRGTEYKYLVLDINFDESFTTDADNALFSTIAAMPRASVVKTFHSSVPRQVQPRAYFSEYGATIDDGNFSKYDYFVHGERSLPLVLCDSVYGIHIKKAGPLYFAGGHLARRTSAFPIGLRLWNVMEQEDGMSAKRWYNLGADIIDMDIDVAALVRDKIVMVGDFCEDDLHDTYIGSVSGPVLNINAIEAVKSGALAISYTSILILFVLYTFIAYCILKGWNVYDIFPPLGRIRSRYVRWGISAVGLGTLLMIVSFMGWSIYGCSPNVWIPAMVFSILVVAKDLNDIKSRSK